MINCPVLESVQRNATTKKMNLFPPQEWFQQKSCNLFIFVKVYLSTELMFHIAGIRFVDPKGLPLFRAIIRKTTGKVSLTPKSGAVSPFVLTSSSPVSDKGNTEF